MAYRNIKTWPHSALKNKSANVNQDEVSSIVTDLIDTIRVVSGAGLAAPQIGISKRVFIIDVSKFECSNPDSNISNSHPEFWVVCNPIISGGSEKFDWKEGCLSVPGVTASVCRDKDITLEYDDLTGERKILNLSPPLSLAVQHESDHLDGKTILDRVSKLKASMFKRKIRKSILKQARIADFYKEKSVKDSKTNKKNSSLSKQEVKKRKKLKRENRKKL